MFHTSLSSYKTRSKKSLDIPLRKKHRKTSFIIYWAKTSPRHAFPFSIKILNTKLQVAENKCIQYFLDLSPGFHVNEVASIF